MKLIQMRGPRCIAGILGLVFSLLVMPETAHAVQSFSVETNGTITFSASTTSMTRISIRGDRIRRIVNDDSAFQMTNDDATGDVFLRLSESAAPEEERGYIVTERGVTISYVLRPVDKAVEAVIITVMNDEQDDGLGSSVGGRSLGFSDDVASSMTDLARSIYIEHIAGKGVPSGRDGRVVRRLSGDGWRASLRVAVAGESGRLVREQEFYTSGVLAIYVATPSLPAHGRSWVIVIEEG